MIDPERAEIVCHFDTKYDRWYACVRIGGTIWSFDCGHLHHTYAVAAKCLVAVEREWMAWSDAERIVIQRSPLIVELRQQGGHYNERGTFIGTVRRMHPIQTGKGHGFDSPRGRIA